MKVKLAVGNMIKISTLNICSLITSLKTHLKFKYELIHLSWVSYIRILPFPPRDRVSQHSQDFAFLYFTVPKSTIFSRTKLGLSLIFQFF